MKPEAKRFTKDSPCTKLDIWNCFVAEAGFADVPVYEAQSKIGVFVPRNMEREGRLIVVNRAGADYYRLTLSGRAWLTRGIRSYVKNHPAEHQRVKHPQHFT